MASIKKLILASQSPFRKELMRAAGLSFTTQVAPIDEHAVQAASPPALASRRAEAKALATAALCPEALVIGADQVLSFEGQAFDKATSLAEATQRLRALAGQVHYLHSAVALAYGQVHGQAALLRCFSVDTAMPMRPLSDAEIAAYLTTNEWQGSVGCYQFEHRGVHLFHGAVGEHSAIIGLPMQQLLTELRGLGINALLQPQPPWVVDA